MGIQAMVWRTGRTSRMQELPAVQLPPAPPQRRPWSGMNIKAGSTCSTSFTQSMHANNAGGHATSNRDALQPNCSSTLWRCHASSAAVHSANSSTSSAFVHSPFIPAWRAELCV